MVSFANSERKLSALNFQPGRSLLSVLSGDERVVKACVWAVFWALFCDLSILTARYNRFTKAGKELLGRRKVFLALRWENIEAAYA